MFGFLPTLAGLIRPTVHGIQTVRRRDARPGADFFTAIQEQLGLKVENTRTPVEVYVIDKVQKPSYD